jgi:hypothetical protein
MKGIQILLLLIVIVIGSFVVVRLRNRLFDFILLLLLVLAAIVFILFPDLTFTVANFLGVGRGTDLIFYLSTLIFWFVLLKLYVRQRNFEKMLTDIIRKDALDKAGYNNQTGSDGKTQGS